MFADRIESKWIRLFQNVLVQSGVTSDSLVCIVAETQSRELNVHLMELAVGAIGARCFKFVATTPPVQTNQDPHLMEHLHFLKLYATSAGTSGQAIPA